jgi:hypothetical protein
MAKNSGEVVYFRKSESGYARVSSRDARVFDLRFWSKTGGNCPAVGALPVSALELYSLNMTPMGHF